MTTLDFFVGLIWMSSVVASMFFIHKQKEPISRKLYSVIVLFSVGVTGFVLGIQAAILGDFEHSTLFGEMIFAGGMALIVKGSAGRFLDIGQPRHLAAFTFAPLIGHFVAFVLLFFKSTIQTTQPAKNIESDLQDMIPGQAKIITKILLRLSRLFG